MYKDYVAIIKVSPCNYHMYPFNEDAIYMCMCGPYC